MKTIFIYLLLFSISFSIVRSQDNKYLSFNEGLQGNIQAGTQPERFFVNGGALNIMLEYHFKGAYIAETEVEGDKYNFLHIEGFAKMGQVGAPALPAHNEIIAMPVNAIGHIVIIDAEYKEYDGFMIHPALEPATDTKGDPEPEFQKDSTIYNADEFFPRDVVEITDTLLSRETPLAVTQIRPVQFNPVSGKIRVYTKIKFRLDFMGGEGSYHSVSQVNSLHYTNLLKRNVINSESIPDGVIYKSNGSRSGEKNYIIITHTEYLNYADSLANWKRQLGYSVEVVSKASWTATEVKNEIHTRYNSWTPKPDYFVIIGDHGGTRAVPGEIHTAPNSNTFATDLYFACMGGTGDWVPDMAHGRISVSSALEAQVVVDKIIDYEKNPVSDASFYQNGLSCAQYQDDDDNAYADRRFCHTSEDIRDYLQNNHGYTSERVYYTNTTASVTTLRYNNGKYSNGQLLPAELRSLSFNWNGGSTDITNAIDSGKFMVFHRDHGFVGGSGWAYPYYTTSHMTNLTNGSKLPVVFSINCHTGEYQLSNCFAEKFLRMENKGAVGVVAAAFYSYSGYNDALAIGMIDAIWSAPGLYPAFGWGGTGTNYTIGAGNDIYTMGDVVNQGLYAMIQNWNGSTSSFEYEHELFQWFGDPAMKIWTTNPNDSLIAATHASTIDCAGTSFSITGSTPGATATIVYNNELIGETVLDASGNGTITYAITSTGTTVTLTVSKLHHKPYHSALTVTGTCPLPPALITNTATGITTYSAFGNGEILKDWGSSVIESGIVFSENPNPEIGGSGVTKVQTSPLITTGTFSVELLPISSSTVYYFRAYAINANGTGYGYDMTYTTLKGPALLPWTEGFENIGGTTTFTADTTSINGLPEWSYEKSNNGRLRFSAGSGYCHSGYHAATMDAYPSGTSINYLTASPDLSNYAASSNLELSFSYMDHGEESHVNDRVWVRGSSADPWVEIYDLYLNRDTTGVWNNVTGLDIDDTLFANGQTFSGTFQIRFGQEDNDPAYATTYHDGFTFDDIVLDGQGPGLWIGTSSADWSTAANWSDGNVPDETDDVIIPEGLSNYPVVNDDLYINSATGNCRCHSLTIQNGAQLTINQGHQLIVNGNVTIEPGGVLHTGN